MEILGMSLAVIIGAILALVLTWFVKGQRPGSLTDLAEQLKAAEEFAKIAVAGAQQLYETEKIEDVERYDVVEREMLELFPNMKSEQAKIIIEGAVWWFKSARKIIKNSDGE